MTRIKICGITRLEDALTAARAGAHALGFVFYAGSPRQVSVATVRDICAALPPFVSTVGLFVNADPTVVHATLSAVPLDLLQFHGDEDEAWCRQFGHPYLKAIRVGPDTDLLECERQFSSARALLLDAQVAGSFGGTGQTFDWSRIPGTLTKPIVLSGGLTPENVLTAVRAVRPWAVDVSSGVEAAKGIKDPARVTAFINEVAHADV